MLSLSKFPSANDFLPRSQFVRTWTDAVHIWKKPARIWLTRQGQMILYTRILSTILRPNRTPHLYSSLGPLFSHPLPVIWTLTSNIFSISLRFPSGFWFFPRSSWLFPSPCHLSFFQKKKMGKNQAYKAMQRARLGSSSAGPEEIEDGMVCVLPYRQPISNSPSFNSHIQICTIFVSFFLFESILVGFVFSQCSRCVCLKLLVIGDLMHVFFRKRFLHFLNVRQIMSLKCVVWIVMS